MKRYLAFAGILLLALMAPAMAQDDAAAPDVPVKAVWSRSGIPLGKGATLGVAFDVPAKHHITDVAFGLFTVTVPDTLGLDFSEPVFPQGVPLQEGEICLPGPRGRDTACGRHRFGEARQLLDSRRRGVSDVPGIRRRGLLPARRDGPCRWP